MCLVKWLVSDTSQHHKEREAHQQTKKLNHELEEELEKLKSSEFSVSNMLLHYHRINRC